MAGARDVRNKIRSIQNTQKITRAMQMVAASKMRRAQERMQHARPYSEKISTVIANVAAASTEYKHPFLIEREANRVGYIIVSSDRGLCGGLNHNLFRAVVNDLDQWRERDVEIDYCTIGSRAAMFFKRFGANIVAQATHLGDMPAIEDLIGAVKVMLDAYESGTVDRVFLVYNHFVNSMTQRPTVEQLLPREASGADEVKHHWDYIYEPDAKDVLDALLTRYIEALVYHAVVENVACEQSARMVAMQAATDNATGLIDELTLVYNKARQAAITQELSEIVAGADAL